MTFRSEGFFFRTELSFRPEVVSQILEQNRVVVGWKPQVEMTIRYIKRKFAPKYYFGSYSFYKNKINGLILFLFMVSNKNSLSLERGYFGKKNVNFFRQFVVSWNFNWYSLYAEDCQITCTYVMQPIFDRSFSGFFSGKFFYKTGL
jgi:hypothetical protein